MGLLLDALEFLILLVDGRLVLSELFLCLLVGLGGDRAGLVERARADSGDNGNHVASSTLWQHCHRVRFPRQHPFTRLLRDSFFQLQC